MNYHPKFNYEFLDSYEIKNNLNIKNRIVMAPTTLKAGLEDGSVSHSNIDYYSLRSKGVGMVIVESVAVNKRGKGFEGQLLIDDDDKIAELSQLAHAIKAGGAKAIIQLYASGRTANSQILRGQKALAPSAIALGKNETPDEMTHEDIVATIDAFEKATKRAILAGFDGIEIHGANLYLIQQFLSENSNQRTDVWGGSLQKRMRLPLAIIEKVGQTIEKEASKDFILGLRQSPEEPFDNGLRMQDSLAFTKEVLNLRHSVDYIHLALKNAFQKPFKDKDAKETVVEQFSKLTKGKTALIVAGLVKTPQEVEDLLDLGADFAAMGRELIIEPNWVQKVIDNDEKAIRYAISPSDFDLFAIPKPTQKWLLTTFRNGFNLTTD